MKEYVTVFCLCLLTVGKKAEDSEMEEEYLSNRRPDAPIKLYYLPISPPCRAVMMTARLLGLHLNLMLTDVRRGDHMTPEYRKMNPMQTIPTMNDSGFILTESRSIITYLVNAYGKNDSLYPRDVKHRAIINQMLFFDIGTLYPRYLARFGLKRSFRKDYKGEEVRKIHEALGWFDTILKGRTFVAGDNITVADARKFDLSAYSNVRTWFKRTAEKLGPYGYREIDLAGGAVLAEFGKYI